MCKFQVAMPGAYWMLNTQEIWNILYWCFPRAEWEVADAATLPREKSSKASLSPQGLLTPPTISYSA